MANRSVQPFVHSSRQKVPILYKPLPFPPKLPLPVEDLDLHLTHDSLGPSEPTTQMASRSVLLFFFAQMTAECPYTLQWDAHFPFKIAPSHGGSGPPCYTLFPRPTRVFNQNSISIGSAVFAGLTSVTDRPTDRPRYSASKNRPHLQT